MYPYTQRGSSHDADFTLHTLPSARQSYVTYVREIDPYTLCSGKQTYIFYVSKDEPFISCILRGGSLRNLHLSVGTIFFP